MYRKTNAFEKLFTSIINIVIAFIFSLPLLLIFGISVEWKISIVILFFLYNFIFLIFNKNRCLGMIIINTYYEKEYVFWNQLLYIILYTLSFSTAVIWIFFPFDLLLINLVFIQLPVILWKGTTLHGLFSGNVTTVKYLNK